MLGGLEEDEAPKGPTMMGREARHLMLSGQGAAGLAAWKVRFSTLSTLHSAPRQSGHPFMYVEAGGQTPKSRPVAPIGHCDQVTSA